jgi:hypothetical protein
VYFIVDDITAADQGLTAAGVTFEQAPHLVHRPDSGIEEWMAFLSEADGNTLALMCRLPHAPA